MAENARNPDVLHQEIARTRDELARTIDTIAGRVSPKNAAKRGVGQVKDNAASMRKKLPGGARGDDFHTGLAQRKAESASGQADVSTAAGGVSTLETQPGSAGGAEPAGRRTTMIAVGVGLVLVVSAVITWRRMHR